MTAKRQPPVRIPIPFERFLEGVLQIDPKKMRASPSKKKAAKKRVAAKKKGG